MERNDLPQLNGDLFQSLFEKNDSDIPESRVLKNCKYSDMNNFIEENHFYKDKFSVYSNNIRSLPNKWNDFREHMNDFISENFKFSIVCLQEIWNIPPFFNPVLTGYKPLMYKTRDPSGSNTNAGGGVGVFVDDKYESEMVDRLSIFIPHVFESVTVRVNISKNKFILVCNIYRPNTGPSAGVKIFNEYLGELLEKINNDSLLKNHEDLILAGDFNIDLLKANVHQDSGNYLDILLNNNIYPTISKPTRITQNSATLIDHLNVKHITEFAKSGILLDSLSDHCPIYYLTCINQPKSAEKLTKVKTRLINENTNLKFQSLVSDQNWESILIENRPSFAFSSFFHTIKSCFEESYPLVDRPNTIKTCPINPWMTSGLLLSRKNKQHLYSRKTLSPTEHNIYRFNSFLKIYKQLCRSAKTNFYANKIKKFKNDSRKSWETIREVLGTIKDKSQVPDFFIENHEIIKGDLNIADGFNKFFSEIGSKLSSEIPPAKGAFNTYLNDRIEENFVFKNITKEDILEVGKYLKPKRSAGIDNLSSKQLKDILPTIADPILHIFNLSLQTGFIPDEFKTAKVVPIYKSESKLTFNSYRPISLLPALSKLLEKVVAKQMLGFLNKHKILYDLQFGFRKGRSTSQPMVKFLDNIYNALNKDEPEITIGIFLDLKKAFDTANHHIILEKLKHYGFRGVSSLWFRNYLTNRKQVVTINGINSDQRDITVGVPQGSVLGPILFLILINDLPNAVAFLSILFADDTTFQLNGKNPSELYDKANIELEKASEWFACNKLTLNISKTKYMLFRHKATNVNLEQLNIKMNNIVLERIGADLKTKSFKFVGLNIDENLSWEAHINKLKTKLAFSNHLISKVKNIFPRDTLITLYNCLFKPHIEYGIIAWGGAPKNKLRGVITAQRKCMRNIYGKSISSHSEPIFRDTKILKFNDLYEYNCLKYIFNFVNNGVNHDTFKMANSIRTKNIVVEKCKFTYLTKLPSYMLPHLWNSYPLYIKTESKFTKFKQDTINLLLSKYSANIRCKNDRCPDCRFFNEFIFYFFS